MLYVTISQHGTQVIGILISSATSLLTNLDMTTAVYIILRNNFYNGHLVTPCRPIREQFVGGVATQKKPNATANFKFGTGFFRFFSVFFGFFRFFFGFFRFFHFGQF